MYRKLLLTLALSGVAFAQTGDPCKNITPAQCKALEKLPDPPKVPVLSDKQRGDYYKALAQANYNAWLESQAQLAIAASQANSQQAAQTALNSLTATFCPGAKFTVDAKGEPGCVAVPVTPMVEPTKPVSSQ